MARWLALVTGSCIISLFIGCTSIETGHYQGATFPSYIAVNLFMFLFIVSAFGDVAEHEVSFGEVRFGRRWPRKLTS